MGNILLLLFHIIYRVAPYDTIRLRKWPTVEEAKRVLLQGVVDV